MKGSTLMNLGIPIQFESDMDGVVGKPRQASDCQLETPACEAPMRCALGCTSDLLHTAV